MSAIEKSAAEKLQATYAKLDEEREAAAKIKRAEDRAEEAIRQVEKANRQNRILIIITAAVGLLSVILQFLSSYEAICRTLSLLCT